MLVKRNDIMRPFPLFEDVFSDLLTLSRGSNSESVRSSYFRSTVSEDESGIKYYLDLPGVTRESISLERLGDKKFYLVATRGSPFQPVEKYIDIPREYDAAKIEAKLENGVLTLFAPRSEKPKSIREKIEIKLELIGAQKRAPMSLCILRRNMI